MAEQFSLTLDELPSRAELDRTRQVLEDRLCEAGNRTACENWGLFEGEILTELRKVLSGLDLIAVLGKAWSAAKELRQIGSATAADGSTDRMKLGQHPLGIDLHPVVTVNLAGVDLPELRFTLRIEGEVAWAVLVVSAGVLSELERASISLKVTLLYGGQVIKGPLSREWCLLDPHPFPNGGYRLADRTAPPEA